MLHLNLLLPFYTVEQSNLSASCHVLYDRIILWLTFGLIAVGYIMITSASIPIGMQLFNDPFYFAKKEVLYIFVSLLILLVTLRIPMFIWQYYSSIMLFTILIMLIIVLIFGNSINGASRWISIGPFCIQPAELSKLSLFCYLANYLDRKIHEVRNNFWGFCKPIVIVILLSILLLMQPDLGTVVVLFTTTLTILFVAGVKLWQFISVISLSIVTITLLILTEPYRIRRIVSFLNPWNDPFGSGYQLTQSLMAFGRGKIWGQGLGNSIQKLEYLPEAHTDFIFAIIGEELGYIGVVLILTMIFILIYHAMCIAYKALVNKQLFSGFLACSIAIWFSLQTIINIGASIGILPTKGLTLPLISYGGSSLFVTLIAIAILLRIDFEVRLTTTQAFIVD